MSACKLPTPEQAGEIIFLRSRGWQLKDISLRVGCSELLVKRTLTTPSLWSLPLTKAKISKLESHEEFGISFLPPAKTERGKQANNQ